jgi:lipopolysaccharide biosynthesis regulator YciM
LPPPWGTLLATVTGAAIALLGQHLNKGSEARAKTVDDARRKLVGFSIRRTTPFTCGQK